MHNAARAHAFQRIQSVLDDYDKDDCVSILEKNCVSRLPPPPPPI